jgi:structural maintenance of chromosome 4
MRLNFDQNCERERVAENVILTHLLSRQAMAEESKVALHAKGAVGGTSEAVKGILRAARKGGELAKVGILGRLGDLATVDEKFDVAVSTACSMLDHIVVQTTAGAQRCLAFLRQHDLGRANFIPLDKMKKGAHDHAVETPEGATRLFELIHPANFSVTPAFYLGVGNTLVAPDLETATRWAYEFDKRWRVVTLDGQLIETSGTMAGGGKSVRKGGMRLKIGAKPIPSIAEDDTVDDSKAIEEQASRAAEELKGCRQRRRDIAQEIQLVTKKIKALSIRLPKLSMEIEGFDTTRVTLTERIPELRAQCELSEQDRASLKKLNKEVEKRKMEMAACAMQASKLESDVARIQKAILEAGGPKLKQQQSVCDKVIKELDETEKKLNEARVAIATSEKAIAKAKVAKVVNEEELKTLKATTQDKLTEFRTLEDGALEVMQKYEEVKILEAEKHGALEEISKEIEVLKKSQSVLKGAEIELMGQAEAIEKQLHDLEKKRLHWASEIDKLHAAEDDEDEYDASDEEAEAEEKMPNEADTEGVPNLEQNGFANSQRSSSLARLTLKSLEQYREDDVKAQISVLETERATLAKNANMGAIAEYRKKEADYLSR